MTNYAPPFNITNIMLDRISSIMKKIGKLDNYKDLNKMPVLRKNNRIKSIHSSLAIEANSLSFGEVKDIINGKLVIGPEKEIQEVKNAYKAYQKMREVDPYNINDIKKIHGIITYLLVEDNGNFRKGNEGVFDEKGTCIFMCPPPSQVDKLMTQLFNWMQDNKKEIHPLILSSIFHYEFVFIHPFRDGNGRTARLWQNIILSNWEEIFEYVPIESEIMKYQQNYYEAIHNCNNEGNSTEFIEFMLRMIDEVLDGLIEGVNKQLKHVNKYVAKLINKMEVGITYSANELMKLVNMKSLNSFRSHYLTPAIENGIIKMSFPNTKTSKNQTYYKE